MKIYDLWLIINFKGRFLFVYVTKCSFKINNFRSKSDKFIVLLQNHHLTENDDDETQKNTTKNSPNMRYEMLFVLHSLTPLPTTFKCFNTINIS